MWMFISKLMYIFFLWYFIFVSFSYLVLNSPLLDQTWHSQLVVKGVENMQKTVHLFTSKCFFSSALAPSLTLGCACISANPSPSSVSEVSGTSCTFGATWLCDRSWHKILWPWHVAFWGAVLVFPTKTVLHSDSWKCLQGPAVHNLIMKEPLGHSRNSIQCFGIYKYNPGKKPNGTWTKTARQAITTSSN